MNFLSVTLNIQGLRESVVSP